MYERNLPEYLANDLAAWKKGGDVGALFLDCLRREFYGCINIADINGSAIINDQTQCLKGKCLQYLFANRSNLSKAT